jgi:shikimate dehydrogenase
MINLRSISGSTAVCGILADPVRFAKTPLLMNEEFRRRHVNAVLVPLHVARERLASAVQGLRAIESFAGAVISMPHKQSIIPLLDTLSPTAQALATVNVFRRDRSGELSGANFDGEGFLAGLATLGESVKGSNVLLIGAGGAATAIAFAIGSAGARSLTIINRTRKRAEELAARVDATGLPVTVGDPARPGGDFDLVVNASNVGMDGKESPIDDAALHQDMVVCDIIVVRPVTPLLEQAKARGCVVQNGEAMLRGQISLIADFLLAS